MAQYFFEFGFVRRGGGKSASGKPYSMNAIAKAAYDSRQKLKDERTGQIYDYHRKGLPEWTGIFLPGNSPDWMRNRQRLWNELEKREDHNRRGENAILSRTWIIAIPAEFDTKEKRERFVIDFGRTLSRQGYVADLSIHPPDKGKENFHIHAQLPMRHITPDSFGGRIRLYDEGKRLEMERQKENYCNLAARHLKRYGHEAEAERFKHAYKKLDVQREEAIKRGDRDFADKLDREPTIHEGPAVREMERKGIKTRVRAENDAIADRNDARKIGRSLEASDTPEEFQKHLDKAGLHLARVDKADYEKSFKDHWDAKEKTGETPPPILRNGEYLVVNKRGAIFRLNEATTGRNWQEMRDFMSPLDRQFVNSLRATETLLQREVKIDRRPVGRDGKPHFSTRGAERTAGLGLYWAASGVLTTAVAIFDRQLTPEEKALRDETTRRQHLESDAIKRAQDEQERKRGGRER